MSNILNQTSEAFDLFMDELGEAPEPDINAGGKLPGISPGGKGTSNTATFDAPRPYLPKGTGYKLLRDKPGYSKLRKSLHGLGRYSYTPVLFEDKLMRTVDLKRPPSNFMRLQDTEKGMRRALNLAEDMKWQKANSNKPTGGSYFPAMDTLLYPKHDPSGIKRHELAHALQYRKLNPKGFKQGPVEVVTNASDAVDIYAKGQEPAHYIAPPKKRPSTIGLETGANIVQKKGIREGLKETAIDIDAKYPDGSKVYSQENRGLSKALGQLAEALPDKPGRFTGRVPNFKGLGAGLVDMFMEGPALQEAKTNPLVGMGNRAEIEAAYDYGL